MLVLTRRVGETVTIGDGVKIRIMETRPGRVTIAIDAPPDVRIGRAPELDDDVIGGPGR